MMATYDTPQGERKIIISDIHILRDVSVKGHIDVRLSSVDFETRIPIWPDDKRGGNMDIANLIGQLEIRLAEEVARKIGILGEAASDAGADKERDGG
jgi:hypothetical protein